MDAKEAKEAIKSLKQMKIQYFCELFEHRALTLAIEALEKQVPKEIEDKFLSYDEAEKQEFECGNCPTCGVVLSLDDGDHCFYCGQKIGWSRDK